jgi:two-component system KDP operon response regulator KdpE
MNSAQILIIDDEAQIRKLLQITLQSNDYIVTEASTAKDGLLAAAELLARIRSALRSRTEDGINI